MRVRARQAVLLRSVPHILVALCKKCLFLARLVRFDCERADVKSTPPALEGAKLRTDLWLSPQLHLLRLSNSDGTVTHPLQSASRIVGALSDSHALFRRCHGGHHQYSLLRSYVLYSNCTVVVPSAVNASITARDQSV